MTAPFPMPNDTHAIDVESRQHNLFGVDLGEGIPRVAMKVGPFFYLPWWLLLGALGLPFLGMPLVLWLLPPTLGLVFGLLPDDGDRLRLVGWFEWLAWVLTGHPPIVNGDTAGAPDTEDPTPIVTDGTFLPVVLTRPTKEATRGEAASA